MDYVVKVRTFVLSLLLSSLSMIKHSKGYDLYTTEGGLFVDTDSPFPRSARIFYGDKMMCSAVVYKETIVITAAHCFENGSQSNFKNYTVVAGWNVDETQTVSITDVYIPQDYQLRKGKAGRGDIAFIRTSSPINIDSQFKIELAKPNMTYASLGGQPLYLFSWGHVSDEEFPKIAKKMPVTLNKFCIGPNGPVNETGCTEHIYDDRLIPSMVDAKSGFICSGDSGGPIIYFQDDIPYIIGILISTNDEICNSSNNEMISTNITEFLKDPDLIKRFPEFQIQIADQDQTNREDTIFSAYFITLLIALAIAPFIIAVFVYRKWICGLCGRDLHPIVEKTEMVSFIS